MARESMAYAVTITEKIPIEGKDRICILKNDQNEYEVIGSVDINIGDICIYFEVDAILPIREEFEFLRKRCLKPSLNGFLIKAMKMFSIYSNGLLIPIKDLNIEKAKSGQDFTDTLNVKKYEYDDFIENETDDAKDTTPFKRYLKSFLYKHIPSLATLLYKNKTQIPFPSNYIPKSNQINIMKCKRLYNPDSPVYISLKLEGCSVTMIVKPKKKDVEIYGRNQPLQSNFKHYFIENGLDKKLLKACKERKCNYALQGEFTHPNVQKGIYKNGVRFNVYLIKDLTNGKYLSYEEMVTFCDTYGFDRVPHIFTGTFKELFKNENTDLKELLDYVEHLWFKPESSFDDLRNFYISDKEERFKDFKGLHRHEGIVVADPVSFSWSYKVKSNEYKIGSDL